MLSESDIKYEYLSDITDKTDRLIKDANGAGKKQKKELLTKAQELADYYQSICEKGGNNTKQFNSFV